MKGRRFCGVTYTIKNATAVLKDFRKMATKKVSSTFIVADRSV